MSPGIPKVIIGIKVTPVVPLLADSEAAIPSKLPCPNSSGLSDLRLASLQETADAVAPPIPGIAPKKIPIALDLNIVFKYGFIFRNPNLPSFIFLLTDIDLALRSI